MPLKKRQNISNQFLKSKGWNIHKVHLIVEL